MKKAVVILGLTALLAGAIAVAQRRGRGDAASDRPPQAGSEAEKKILAVLEQMAAARSTYLSVPVSDGKMLRILAESIGAKSVAEIGTSTGYSGLWFLLALHKTGGRLTTFEMDPGRAAIARKHFDQSGFGNLVTIIQGDAHENVGKLKGPLDLVFIDADKPGYVDYLNKTLPLVRPGGLLLAHNVPSIPEYMQQVLNNPALETVVFNEGGGLAITVKKR
jgi:predicted O-methyltransferase YrrM